MDILDIEKYESEESESETESESEESESETAYGEFKFRIQLTTSHNKTDVYLIKKNEKYYIIKGPFLNDTIPKKYIEMQLIKQELGLPIINTKLIYMYPDRWLEGVPLGIRNKCIRTKKYPFLVIDSLLTESEYKLKMHSSKLWTSTQVIDIDKIKIHFKDYDDLSKQQLIDYYNALAYRIKYKYSDLANRNFLIYKDRLYSIDEESVNESFNLLNELKKNKYEYLKTNYKKYRKYMNEKLVKYTDNEFMN